MNFKFAIVLLVLLVAVHGSDAGWASFFGTAWRLVRTAFTRAPQQMSRSPSAQSIAQRSAQNAASNTLGHDVIAGSSKYGALGAGIGGGDVVGDVITSDKDYQARVETQRLANENALQVLDKQKENERFKHESELALLDRQHKFELEKKQQDHELALKMMNHQLKNKLEVAVKPTVIIEEIDSIRGSPSTDARKEEEKYGWEFVAGVAVVAVSGIGSIGFIMCCCICAKKVIFDCRKNEQANP